MNNIYKQTLAAAKYVCPECKHISRGLDELWDHFESEHALDGGFSCTCRASYERMPDFLRHYIGCPVAATDLQDLSNDGIMIKKVTRECINTCSKSCDTQAKLENISEKSDSCSVSEEGSETYHKYRHPPVSPIAGPSDDKPFGCPKCPKGFKSKSLLEQHMHIHYPPRYKCRWCGNLYRWPPVYYHHKQKCKQRPGHNSDEKCKLSLSCGNEKSLRVIANSTIQNHIPPPTITASRSEGNNVNNNNEVKLIQNDELLLPNGLCNLFSVAGTRKTSFSLTNPERITCLCTEVLPNLDAYFKHVTECTKFIGLSAQPPASSQDNFNLQAQLPPTLYSQASSASQPLLSTSVQPTQSYTLSSHQHDHQSVIYSNTQSVVAGSSLLPTSVHVGSPPFMLSANSTFPSTQQFPSPPPAVCLDLSSRKKKRESHVTCIKTKKYTKGIADQCKMNADGSYKCIECSKDFSSKLSLKQHIDGKHRPEGKYLCSGCGKRYRWGASFYYHKRNCVQSEETSVPIATAMDEVGSISLGGQSSQQRPIMNHSNVLTASS